MIPIAQSHLCHSVFDATGTSQTLPGGIFCGLGDKAMAMLPGSLTLPQWRGAERYRVVQSSVGHED